MGSSCRTEDARSGDIGDAPRSAPSVLHVCLTGGPCGGKTTALPYLREQLHARGITVLSTAEVANLLFSGGVQIHDLFDFQQRLLAVQVSRSLCFVHTLSHTTSSLLAFALTHWLLAFCS